MAWRAARSITVLFGQVNAIAPARSKASDGTIGDAAHQGTTSDHNPHYVPGVGSDIVTAGDFTHDPAHGFDSYVFAEQLRLSRDPRIKYVISNRRIFSSYSTSSRPAWTWGTYSGTADPHTNHAHVSVVEDARCDGTQLWNLGILGSGDDDMFCKKGDTGPKVEALQRAIVRAGGSVGTVDGHPDFDGNYGANTASGLAAVIGFGDGTVYGPAEYDALMAEAYTGPPGKDGEKGDKGDDGKTPSQLAIRQIADVISYVEPEPTS